MRLLLSVLLLAAVVLSGCGGDGDDAAGRDGAADHADPTAVIGVSLLTRTHPFYQDLEAGIDQMQTINVLFDVDNPGSCAGLMSDATEAIMSALPGWIAAPLSVYDELLDSYEVFNYCIASCTLYHLIGQFTLSNQYFTDLPEWCNPILFTALRLG